MDIIRIRHFAETNDTIGFDFNGEYITNPWDGRSTKEALELYGEKNMLRFCRSAMYPADKVEVPREYVLEHDEEIGVQFWKEWMSDWTGEIHFAEIEFGDNDTYVFQEGYLVDSCHEDEVESYIRELEREYAWDNCPPSPDTFSYVVIGD